MLETSRLKVTTPCGRVLVQELNMVLDREKVALIGRNGVGKSTLLEILAGVQAPNSGQVVRRGATYLVGQLQNPQNESHGQLRKRRLLDAFAKAPEILLLDEPTQDLDWAGIGWLRGRLAEWSGGALVASHDRALLQDFHHFFVLSEKGCRYFQGTLKALEVELESEEAAAQARYLSGLNRMLEHAEHTDKVARRRGRKARFGRVREIDRGSPRVILNMKRDQKQVTHGKQKAVREARLEAVRQLSKAGRRALQVQLPLVLPAPEWGFTSPDYIVRLEGRFNLQLRHQRVAVTGPNGAGKTTLLNSITWSNQARLGSIAQGGSDWMLEECLLELLGDPAALVAHKFPLALAERPLRSLSPGERVRAALICLFQRAPAVELLRLDEPTYSLDLLGKKALTTALRTWPGGLLVASHDLDFLKEIGIEQWIRLE